MMKVLGIVGGIGAGKTTIVSLIKQMKDTFVISADQIGHQLLLKGNMGYQQVVDHFGKEILSDSGEIVRKRLGELVFKDSQKLRCLNKITHPLIYNEVKRQIEVCQKQAKFEFIIIDAALLIEIGLTDFVDVIVAVYANDEVRINRLMKREGLSKEQILERFKAQKKWEEFTSITHTIIDNSFELENTEKQIKKIIDNL
jgi:dephospho-CoA kinase